MQDHIMAHHRGDPKEKIEDEKMEFLKTLISKSDQKDV